MFTKLEKHRGQFLTIEQETAAGLRGLEGKLVELTPEWVTLKVYDKKGSEDSEYTIPISTIVLLVVGDAETRELQFKVSMAQAVEGVGDDT